MLKSYKYELNPTEEQKVLINKTFGCVRFVYNWGLAKKKEAWEKDKKYITRFEFQKELPLLKKSEEYGWLKIPAAQSLINSLINLDLAYKNFFREVKKGNKTGFPKFKSKNSKQSVQFPNDVSIKRNQIRLPKIGLVKYYKSREIEGKIKTTTVSKTPAGRYFVSILCDTGVPFPEKKEIKKSTAVGIDLGIKTFAYTSDGQVVENQKYLEQSLKKLRVEQRSLARKKKGSKSRERQRLKVAKVYEKVANQRKDFLHNISTELIRRYDTIVIEDLNIKDMIQNKNLARAISDCGWWNFREMLTYKAEWYGKNLVVIDKFEPSSKMCSGCGEINKELKLSDRKWECKSCKTNHDRDFNAAKNIRQMGLNKVAGDAANCELTCDNSQSVSQRILHESVGHQVGVSVLIGPKH